MSAIVGRSVIVCPLLVAVVRTLCCNYRRSAACTGGHLAESFRVVVDRVGTTYTSSYRLAMGILAVWYEQGNGITPPRDTHPPCYTNACGTCMSQSDPACSTSCRDGNACSTPAGH